MRAGKIGVIVVSLLACTVPCTLLLSNGNTPAAAKPSEADSIQVPNEGQSGKSDYVVQLNPDVNPVIGFTVISDDNILGYTKSAIIHFDGRRWNVLYRAQDSQINSMDTDGRYVAFSSELLRFGASMTTPRLYVGVLHRHRGEYELSDVSSFEVPLGHSLDDVKFVGPGEGFLTSIFEYAHFRLAINPDNHLAIHIMPHLMPLGSNSGGAKFGSSVSDGEVPLAATNQGALAEVTNGVLKITPLLDIYKNDAKSFELNEGLTSCSMFHPDAAFFLSNERIYFLSREKGGAYKTNSYREVKIADGGSIAATEVSSILAMNDTDVYALTETGLLLKGEYSRRDGGMRSWAVVAILPIYGNGVLAKLNQDTILVGGTSIVEYSTNSARDSTKTESEGNEISGAARFTLSMFDAGTAYGVGIGNFDRNSGHPYVYLVELTGQNKLYIDKEGSNLIGNNFDIADQRGVAGRFVETAKYGTNFDIGVAIGDINEDGNDDILVSYLVGPPVVLVNNGAGYFRDETKESGLNTDLMRSECITLADVNNDGYLDVFATSFVGSDRLFINEGGGKFREVTRKSGVSSNGRSITAVFGDINGDGYPDLYVGRWNAENSLYLNNGDGTFRDITKESGTGCGELHETNSVLLADFNNDGKLDIFVGNREGGNKLFLNEGNGHFKDVTKESGLADIPPKADAPPVQMFAYGSVFGDFQDDGRLDLLIAGLTTVKYFENLGSNSDGVPVFKDESKTFLPPSENYNGYNTGVATFDADGNGDLDAVIGQYQGHSMFLQNNLDAVSGEHRNFVEVNVEGVKSNRDGIGAKVILLKDGKMIAYREVMSSYGYASSSSRTQLFGITDPNARYQVEVDFPVSGVKRIVDVQPGSKIDVQEYTGFNRVYFLFRKDLTRLLMSIRFQTTAFESVVVLLLVLVLATVKVPFLNSSGRLSTYREKAAIAVFSLIVFAFSTTAIYILGQIFFSTSGWIMGSRDIVVDNLVPAVLTVFASGALLKGRRERDGKQAMKKEVFGRLYTLLRKFGHGEGGMMVLNRLMLFAENLDSLNDRKKVTFNDPVSELWRRTENKNENDENDPYVRFGDALDEYKETVHAEIQSIIALINVILDSADQNGKFGSLRKGLAVINASSASLMRDVNEFESLLTSKRTPFEYKKELRTDLLKAISAMKSALYETSKALEGEFVTEVRRAVAEEIGKFRREYSDFLFKYDDMSAGVKGIINETELRDIISNLVRNSIEAVSMFDGPESSKTISLRTYVTASRVVTEAEDNGPGIPAENRDVVFGGSFTTKGKGHGFGLKYARACLSKYGGEIRLDASYTNGARFIIEVEKAE